MQIIKKFYEDESILVSDDIGGSTENIDHIQFDLTPTTEATVEGEMKWNATEGTVNIGMPGGNVSLSVGQEMYIPRRCRNATGSDMPNGYIVYINGVSGNRPTIIGADADTEVTSTKTIGMTTEAITNGNNGYVTTFGVVRDVDTNAYSVGDALWLSSTTGGYTSTRPAAPKHAVFIGYVLKKGTTDGEIFVNIQNGYELDELHDVLIGTKNTGDVLTWNGTVWASSAPALGGGSVKVKLADYQGVSSIGILGVWTFDEAKTLGRFSLVAESIPVGSNCIIELRKNSTSSGNLLSSTLQIATTDTLTNGQKYVTTTGFSSASVVAGDYVVAYLTSVGSTTPSINVSSYLTFS